jgi:hypothetical protein
MDIARRFVLCGNNMSTSGKRKPITHDLIIAAISMQGAHHGSIRRHEGLLDVRDVEELPTGVATQQLQQASPVEEPPQ